MLVSTFLLLRIFLPHTSKSDALAVLGDVICQLTRRGIILSYQSEPNH